MTGPWRLLGSPIGIRLGLGNRVDITMPNHARPLRRGKVPFLGAALLSPIMVAYGPNLQTLQTADIAFDVASERSIITWILGCTRAAISDHQRANIQTSRFRGLA